MAKYQPYPEYKSSGVEWLGDVPSGWSPLKGKYIFDNIVKLSISGNEELLSVSEYYGVKPRSLTIAEGEHLTRAENLIGYKKCQKNDLVMNIMLAWKRGLGVSDYNGIVSPAYSVFRFSNTIFPQYMHYLLRTNLYTSNFKSRSTGVIDSRLRLYPETFGNVEILTPDLFEQQQIASFLDYETAQMDELVAKQEKLIELLKEKRQAVISHAVTKGLNPNAPMKDSGVEWLGQIPKHWKCAGFKKYINKIIDYRGKTPNKTESGTVLITARNIKNGSLDYSSLEYIDPRDYDSVMSRGLPNIGDVLFTMEAPLGEVAQVDKEDIALAQRIVKFTGIDNVLNNSFLKYYILSSPFQDSLYTYATGSTALGIKAERLSYLKQLIPTHTEQQEIVAYLDNQTAKIDKTIEKAEQAIELLKERRTALISAAVTGKIDVRSWQHPAGQKTKEVNVA